MNFRTKKCVLAVGFAAMSACGGAETGGGTTTIITAPSPTTGPIDPSVSAATYIRADTQRSAVNDLPNTNPLYILPTGTATYEGHLLAKMSVDGEDSIDGIYGEIEMTVELLGAGDDVDGTISNLHTMSGETLLEQLTGELSMDGLLDDGTKTLEDTSLTGELTGYFGGSTAGEIRLVDGTFEGHTRDEGSGFFDDKAVAIYGSVDTAFSGSQSGTISGAFYVDK